MADEIILVVGGGGFVGFHVVKALVQNPDYTAHVLSHNPARNQVPGAYYHAGSILSPEQLQIAFAEIRPSLIIYAASPVPACNTGASVNIMKPM